VSAGRAALKPTEWDELTVIDERPVLQALPLRSKYISTSSGTEELSKVVALVVAKVVTTRSHYRLTLSCNPLLQHGS